MVWTLIEHDGCPWKKGLRAGMATWGRRRGLAWMCLQATNSPGPSAEADGLLEPFEGAQPRQHLDFRLLGATTGRQQIPVVEELPFSGALLWKPHETPQKHPQLPRNVSGVVLQLCAWEVLSPEACRVGEGCRVL